MRQLMVCVVFVVLCSSCSAQQLRKGDDVVMAEWTVTVRTILDGQRFTAILKRPGVRVGNVVIRCKSTEDLQEGQVNPPLEPNCPVVRIRRIELGDIVLDLVREPELRRKE